jgi:predicted  nucleic acid-binding Zn-ribbon protein
MSGPASTLREIHRLRRLDKDLEGRIAQQPRLLRAQQNAVAKQEEALREAHDALKRLKVTTHEKEVSLKTTSQQIVKHEKQLNEAATKKEYDALKSEIAAGRDEVRRLEDEILDTMAQTEEQTAQLPQLEKAVQQARAEQAQFERDSEARLNALNEQRARIQRELAETEATLPADARPQYARLVKAMGEDALAAVEGRTCTACYTEITAQQANEVNRGQLVFCKNCGRILYTAEESS